MKENTQIEANEAETFRYRERQKKGKNRNKIWNCERRIKHYEVKPPNKRKSIKKERITERERERALK